MTIYNGPVVPLKRRGSKTYEIKAAANDEAEVWLYGMIGDSWEGTTGKQFADDLKALGKSIKTLNVYINSPGGSAFDGVAIHNVLKRHNARKIVQIDGVAASIASVVAMAGDEIRIAENGMMMIHDPWALAMGNSADLRKMAEALDKVRDAILSSYVARTTTGEEQLQAWMADETWFTAAEAVSAGLADEISGSVAMAAFANLDLSPYKHPPQDLIEAAQQQPENEPDAASPHSAVAVMATRVMARGLGRQETA